MKTLPLNALRALAMIHSSGGVRAAARELGIAHSSVSRHLAELEAWLDVRLTTEATRSRTLFTTQGDALGKAVVAALRDIERAVDAVREVRSPHTVTISTTASFAVRWLLPRLSAFEQRNRNVEISVLVDQRLQDLDAADIDISLRMGRGGWKGVRARPWMDDVLFPVMSPTYHATTRRPKKPSALVGLRLLHDRDPSASWEVWRSAHGPRTLDVRRGPRLASSDLVLRAAAQGDGVALARGRLVHDDLKSGALLRPIPDLEVPIGPAYWIVEPERDPRPAVAAVIEWLEYEARRAAVT
jgi:LysR family glycine cleavage system transcriptional activator